MDVSKREIINGKIVSEFSGSQQLKAELAEAIQHRIDFLEMTPNAFMFNAKLSLTELSALMNGEESEITADQLREALDILNLSDDAREITEMRGISTLKEQASPNLTPEPRPNYVGSAIHHYRKKFNLSQVDLASKLDVSGTLISQWERNNIRVDANDLPRIAEAIGIDLLDLLNTTYSLEAFRRGTEMVAVLPDEEKLLLDVFRSRNEVEKRLILEMFSSMRQER